MTGLSGISYQRYRSNGTLDLIPVEVVLAMELWLRQVAQERTVSPS